MVATLLREHGDKPVGQIDTVLPSPRGEGEPSAGAGGLPKFASIRGSGEICGNLGILRSGGGFAVPCVAGLANVFSQTLFPVSGISRHLYGHFAAGGQAGRLVRTAQKPPVGVWSARTQKKAHNSLAWVDSFHFLPISHNPEVVGSNPAPATIRKSSKSSDFEDFFVPGNHSGIVGSVRF